MVVKVKDLKPNPFRKIDKYPIDKVKVESLKESIKNTSMWRNLIGREHNGEIQIAYGHHRLFALQELGIEEIDIDIQDFDDSMMIKIMANENMTEWSSKTSVIVETIQVAKEYLEREIAKYDDYDHVNKNIKVIFSSNSQFLQCKESGVGQTTILKFLGKNWKQWQIQKALEIINDNDIDKDAFLQVENIGYATDIKQIVKEHNIPKEKQKEVIEKSLEKVELLPRKNGVCKNTRLKAATEDVIEEIGYETKKENFNKVYPKDETEDKPDVNDALNKCTSSILSINSSLVGGLLDSWEEIDDNEKKDFIVASKRFFEIIKNKFKGGKEWNQLLLKE